MMNNSERTQEKWDETAGVLEQLAADIRAGKFAFVNLKAERSTHPRVLPGGGVIHHDLTGRQFFRVEVQEKKEGA